MFWWSTFHSTWWVILRFWLNHPESRAFGPESQPGLTPYDQPPTTLQRLSFHLHQRLAVIITSALHAEDLFHLGNLKKKLHVVWRFQGFKTSSRHWHKPTKPLQTGKNITLFKTKAAYRNNRNIYQTATRPKLQHLWGQPAAWSGS